MLMSSLNIWNSLEILLCFKIRCNDQYEFKTFTLVQATKYKQVIHSLKRSYKDLISSIGDDQNCKSHLKTHVGNTLIHTKIRVLNNSYSCFKSVKIDIRQLKTCISQLDHNQCLIKIKYSLLSWERTRWDFGQDIRTNHFWQNKNFKYYKTKDP